MARPIPEPAPVTTAACSLLGIPIPLLSPVDQQRGISLAYFLSSYLNETLSLVRKASTLPFSITRSCSTTSATRRSRSVREARRIAAAAASSQDFGLVPISSRTL